MVFGITLNILSSLDLLYIIVRNATQEFQTGSVAIFGIGTGALVYVLAVGFVLPAILVVFATVFTAIKINY